MVTGVTRISGGIGISENLQEVCKAETRVTRDVT